MRDTTDTLRRAFDSTLANWPLIVIRIAETIVLFMIVAAAILAAIMPVAVAAGISSFDNLANAGDATQFIAQLVVEHWLLIVYVLVVFSVLFVLLIAIHSFVDGGTAQVLIDADKVAGAAAFNTDRWFAGGRSSWWAIFWIYNIIWTFACVVILLPLSATIAGMLMVQEPGGRVAIGCIGLALSVIVMIPMSVIAAIWTQKSIAVCVARSAGARAAIAAARQEITRDLSRHLVVAIVYLAVSIGGSMVLSMLTAPLSFIGNRSPVFIGMSIPVQIVASFLQSIFSAAVGVWFLASYVTLTQEGREAGRM